MLRLLSNELDLSELVCVQRWLVPKFGAGSVCPQVQSSGVLGLSFEPLVLYFEVSDESAADSYMEDYNRSKVSVAAEHLLW